MFIIKKILNNLNQRSLVKIYRRTCFQNNANYAYDPKNDKDMPIDVPNPYKEEKKICILCKYDLEVNYKNVRLLSQFLSPYTGLLYSRNITELCDKQYKLVKYHLKISQYLGLIPRFHKKPEFLDDPKLFNSFKPKKVNDY